MLDKKLSEAQVLRVKRLGGRVNLAAGAHGRYANSPKFAEVRLPGVRLVRPFRGAGDVKLGDEQ